MLARLTVAVTALVTYPPRLLHEATHAVLSAPHAATWRLSLTPTRGGAGVEAEWRDDAPRWGVVLAHLGPLICGALLGVATLVWVLAAGYVPNGVTGWAKVSVLAMWWTIYTWPSQGDRAVLHGGGGL